jgi:hypothetical protein
LRFTLAPSYAGAVDVMVEIGKEGGVRAHRPAVLRACTKALQLCHGTDGLAFADAAIRMREQDRLVGRPLPGRAVGSTLLLKGLEAEVETILAALAHGRFTSKYGLIKEDAGTALSCQKETHALQQMITSSWAARCRAERRRRARVLIPDRQEPRPTAMPRLHLPDRRSPLRSRCQQRRR